MDERVWRDKRSAGRRRGCRRHSRSQLRVWGSGSVGARSTSPSSSSPPAKRGSPRRRTSLRPARGEPANAVGQSCPAEPRHWRLGGPGWQRGAGPWSAGQYRAVRAERQSGSLKGTLKGNLKRRARKRQSDGLGPPRGGIYTHTRNSQGRYPVSTCIFV